VQIRQITHILYHGQHARLVDILHRESFSRVVLERYLVFFPRLGSFATIRENLLLGFVLWNGNNRLVAVRLDKTSRNPGKLLVHHVHIVGRCAGATILAHIYLLAFSWKGEYSQ